MNRITLFLACFVLAASPALADTTPHCKAKEERIQRQLEYARKYGNAHKIEGLERALANVGAWCTDNSLKSKAEMKVLDKQEEVFERERDLEEAKSRGKADKIAKRERKLEEARRELDEAQARRDALQ